LAVETFFLFGFRALSDLIKEIFPPGEDNILAKILEKVESNEIDSNEFINIAEKALIKYMEVASEDKDLKFHLLKQLEPAYGYKFFLKLEPLITIIIAINKGDTIFKLKKATPEDLTELPGILFPVDLLKRFLIEDLDVLKLITEDKIQIEKFEILNEIIVRALLGFTSAFFLKDEFRERVNKELSSLCNK